MFYVGHNGRFYYKTERVSSNGIVLYINVYNTFVYETEILPLIKENI